LRLLAFRCVQADAIGGQAHRRPSIIALLLTAAIGWLSWLAAGGSLVAVALAERWPSP
jgi:hypothetical protein